MAQFSWKRGFKHAALPLIVTFISGIILVSAAKTIDPGRLGEATGKVMATVLLLALLVSFFAQTGKHAIAWAIGVGVPALAAAGVIAALALGGSSIPPMTAAERAPLVRETIAGEPRIRHPALGFSFHDPGASFVTSPIDVGQAPGTDPTLTTYYLFRNDADAKAILVAMVKGAPTNEADFRGFVDGMVSGIAKSAAKNGETATPKTTREDVTWTDGRGEARVDVSGTTFAITVGAHTVRPAGSVPFVVAIIVPADGSLDAVLTSFKSP